MLLITNFFYFQPGWKLDHCMMQVILRFKYFISLRWYACITVNWTQIPNTKKKVLAGNWSLGHRSNYWEGWSLFKTDSRRGTAAWIRNTRDISYLCYFAKLRWLLSLHFGTQFCVSATPDMKPRGCQSQVNFACIKYCITIRCGWHVECKHTMVYMCISIREYKCKVEVTSVICITLSSCMNMVCDGAYCICSSHTGVSNRDWALTMH